ncbi:hypothetical protein ACOSP7_030166 [Xanthoceras sorbifolium]
MTNNLESKTDQQVIRPLVDFPSNVWKDIDTFNSDIETRILEFNQTYGRQIKELKDKVREMLMAPTNDPIEKVTLINSLSRLGVSYHLQAEIEEHLNHIFESQPSLPDDNDHDLYTTALLFRVLRQHGYKLSSSKWDISALDDLPDYMKIIYSALLNIFDEIYNDLTEEERSYKFSYTKDTMKEMVKAYFAEAEWFYQNYVPPFNEYLRYSLISIGSFSYTAAKFLGMEEEIAGIDAFEWLQSRPKILTAAYVIARLKNDLIGHKYLQDDITKLFIEQIPI